MGTQIGRRVATTQLAKFNDKNLAIDERRTFMKRRSLVLLIGLTIGIALAFNSGLALAQMTAKDLVKEAQGKIEMISPEDAKAKHDKGGVIFLDCRTEDEFKAGHIPGAMHIPRGLLEFKIESKVPDKNAEIIVYCKSGARASLATNNLVRMGYKNAENLDGGWKAWLSAGYPVE